MITIELVNINYQATLLEPIDPKLYRRIPPTMAVISVQQFHCKIIAFKSGKCRIMGLKKPISQEYVVNEFPIKLKLGPILSCTRAIDFQTGPLNLPKLSKIAGYAGCLIWIWNISRSTPIAVYTALCEHFSHWQMCYHRIKVYIYKLGYDI